MLIHRAAVLQNRQFHTPGKGIHRLFMDIKHGADLGNAGAVQVGYRLEAADPALIDERHQEGFHRVIVVVAQRQLVAAPVKQGLIEGAAAHLGAHGAGIFFLSVVKNNGADFGFYHGVGHLQLFAQGFYPAVVHPQAHIDGDGLQGKGFVVVAPQGGQEFQQHQRILAPGNTYGNFISIFNHIVIFHAPANQAHQSLHWVNILQNHAKWNVSIYEYLRAFASI